MTQGQFCKSCVATVEALFEYAENKAKETHSLDLKADEVAGEMCKQKPFPYYKDFFQTGCEQIVAKNLTTLTAPLMNREHKVEGKKDTRKATGRGESTVFKSDTLKFEHQKTFCRDIGACPETFFAMGRETIKDGCGGCHEFVWDFKVILAREKAVTPARVVDVLTTMCEKLALLHLRPGRIEDACERFVETWYEDYLEAGDEEKFSNRVAANIDDIMVGRHDISTAMCSEYIDVCKTNGKSKKKRKKKKKSKGKKNARKKSAKPTKSKNRNKKAKSDL
eukprot:CAMPEP_0185267612 /NCGR_PEP_ID=MMETSP1359-20130426/34849_1 /TAXON_ID=552665 /ORGANISM="Bigelowiella longifila, Strain CCMP242" /LENGTH=278 /DNA_ID=CAMNT_0027858025 /DNA_START=49 /DNA_END=885 /DNA_ORIENTATION=-